jgi:hypothetical protein
LDDVGSGEYLRLLNMASEGGDGEEEWEVATRRRIEESALRCDWDCVRGEGGGEGERESASEERSVEEGRAEGSGESRAESIMHLDPQRSVRGGMEREEGSG